MTDAIHPLHWLNNLLSLASTFLYCYMVPVSVFGAISVQSNKGTKIRAAWENFLHPRIDVSEVANPDLLRLRLPGQYLGQDDGEYPIICSDIQLISGEIDIDEDYSGISELSGDERSSYPSLSLHDPSCLSEDDDDGAQTDCPSFDAGCVFAARPEPTHDCKHALDEDEFLSHSESSTVALHADTNDMTIISLSAYDYAVQEIPHECCAGFVCDIDKENDILGVLRRDRRNIVLDSSYPHLAPHIVVSPPETCWEEFYAPFRNRVEPQSLASLVVPPLPPSFFHSSRPPALDTPCDIHSSSLACSAFSPKEHSVPRRRRASAVFSLSRFSRAVRITQHSRVGISHALRQVLLSSTERLIFRHVVDAIHRHRYKATVYEACEAAPAVCERFNSSNCATRLEQPFVWSDPAQALLSASRRFQGTVIFESDFPFNAPHIMISEIPPQNPWIAWGNSTNPQDFDCLSVFATCAPGLQPDIDNGVETLLSDCGANNEASACGTDLFSGDAAALASDNHSREASPWPATPPHGDELRSVHVHDSQDTWETGRDACSADADASLIWNIEEATGASCSRTMSAGFSQSRCESPTPDSDDEDEDDLPPFDDWYISVVERSKHIVV